MRDVIAPGIPHKDHEGSGGVGRTTNNRGGLCNASRRRELGAAVYGVTAARAFISPTAFEQARAGEALWERVEAGPGSLGAASSESAAGSSRLRARGCSCGC